MLRQTFLLLILLLLCNEASCRLCCAPECSLTWLNDDYALAFRATAGVGQSVYQTYIDGQRDDDRPVVRAFLPPGCLATAGACDRHYHSSLLNDWPSTQIDKVRFSLYRQGTEVAYILFDGRNSTKLSWFSKDRVLETTWSDLLTENQNYFSIEGHYVAGNNNRRFYIFRNYGGCPADYGWVSVQDQNYDVCEWGRLSVTDPYPAILYSNQATVGHYGSPNVSRADVLTVTVKFLNVNGKKCSL